MKKYKKPGDYIDDIAAAYDGSEDEAAKKHIKAFAELLEGVLVAITQTAKTLVDISEMGWKVATSRPILFIGRKLIDGVEKLFDKLHEIAKKIDKKFFDD